MILPDLKGLHDIAWTSTSASSRLRAIPFWTKRPGRR
jgi:hypothetical protein